MAESSKSDRIFRGRYLFHFHTHATDGRLKIADYFCFAQSRGFESLIFLEHIRRNPSYDVDRFIDEIKEASESIGLPARVGFEAKILPDGRLDINDEHAEQAEVLGIAEHGFSGGVADLSQALANAFRRHGTPQGSQVLVWVHPGLYLKKRGLLDQELGLYRDLLDEAARNGVRLERNMRYDLCPRAVFEELEPESRVVGADAHGQEDLIRYADWLPS